MDSFCNLGKQSTDTFVDKRLERGIGFCVGHMEVKVVLNLVRHMLRG